MTIAKLSIILAPLCSLKYLSNEFTSTENSPERSDIEERLGYIEITLQYRTNIIKIKKINRGTVIYCRWRHSYHYLTMMWLDWYAVLHKDLYYAVSHFLALASLHKIYKALWELYHSTLDYSHDPVSCCQYLTPSSQHHNIDTYYTSNPTLIQKCYTKEAWSWSPILIQQKVS